MQDFSRWSFPLGRFFGIPVRVHLLFPIVAAGMILRVAYQKEIPPGTWLDATMLTAILFVVVLLHEFGHCFGARAVDGDAQEVLMWPLGGLAFVDVPHTPRANFIATVAGPAVNVLLCLVSGFAFFWLTRDEHLRLPLSPLPAPHGWYPYRVDASGLVLFNRWDGSEFQTDALAVIVAARLFWVSWMLLLLNVCVPAFPLDGGRMLQCAVWWRTDFRRGTKAAVYGGFAATIVFGILSMVINELLPFALAMFILIVSVQQWMLLEGGEDSLLGYDFSQGYTSLERDEPPPRRRRKRPNVWQRWWQRRAQRKLQRQQEQREAEERRMDELLEKVQRDGLHALTDEERRFLKRVSDKYRNRQ
jgi:stage IV sporulation protein FB